MQRQHRPEKLLYVLCTTVNGSKYVQKCLEGLLTANFNHNNNNNGNNGNINNNQCNGYGRQNCNFNVNFNNNVLNRIGSIISDFCDSISSFGHLLCVHKYGHYAIDKLLAICYQFSFINVLQKFITNIIIKNFSMVVQHTYPCRIVQNMLDSNSHQLKIYILTQLNTLFYPQKQLQLQHQLQQPLQITMIRTTATTVANNTIPASYATAMPQTIPSTVSTKATMPQIDTSHAQSFASEVKSDENTERKEDCAESQTQNNLRLPKTQEEVVRCGDFQLLYETINHQVGNYIIQAMIKTACNSNISCLVEYIFDFVSKHNRVLACNKFGCRVVQCCIMSSNVSCLTKSRLFASIVESLGDICNDEHGNYCVQKCLEHARYDIKKVFVEQILFGIDLKVKNYADSSKFSARYTLPGSLRSSFENYILNVQNPNSIINFSKFSFGKHSSIVCDMAFRHATTDQQEQLVCYLCNPRIAVKYNVLFGLINHEYGNFVIKNAITTLIKARANALRDKNNVINNGVIVSRAYAHDIQQREKHYSSMLNSMKQALNNTFNFVSKYHCHNKFSFAYNVIKLINDQ